MKDYRKSDYAINKNRKGIVYRNADGSTLEITFEKIAEGDPKFTYADFEKLKKFSDHIYLEQARKEDSNSYYEKASLDTTKETDWLSTPSLEENFFEEQFDLPTMEEVKAVALRHLTPIQKRRILMYLEGLSTVKIAEIEGCNQKSVWESIEAAKNKIKLFLK